MRVTRTFLATGDQSAAILASESGTTDFSLGTSAMGALMERLDLLAPLDLAILITGETGVGKTHLGRVIHNASGRKEEPFVAVACGVLSETAMESEIFGQVGGAFADAHCHRRGEFSLVEEGTLLLDQVDRVPVELQAKVLRVLEERVFQPVGSNEWKPFCGRLIATANRPLAEEVEAGRFRADLYDRLSAIQFAIPPLRQRAQMVHPLAERFAARFSLANGRPFHGFSPTALTAMETYDWPGNASELRNVVERAVVLCPRRPIDATDFPEKVQRYAELLSCYPHGNMPGVNGNGNGNGLDAVRRSAERGRLLQALRHNQNNRSQAAMELGVSRVTLYKKLRRYGLA